MNFNSFLSIILYFYAVDAYAVSSICNDWFMKSNVKPGIFCVFDCAVSKTTNESSHCPVHCPDLCEVHFEGAAYFKLANIYPGLTIAERALVSSHPAESVRAYAYSWKAERTCEEIYASSLTNDESDACRHYVWAGILYGQLGIDFAQKILDAHESNSAEPLEERSMDYANNRAGMLSCQKLQTSKSCTAENLLAEYLVDLKAGRLIVIRPRIRKEGQ